MLKYLQQTENKDVIDKNIYYEKIGIKYFESLKQLFYTVF
jgi:hypothetical protein